MVDSTSPFLCAISGAMMTDPVCDPEGNHYERSAIENWLKDHSTSPVTNNPLTIAELHANEALRLSIDQPSSSTSAVANPADAPGESFDLQLTSSWRNDAVHLSLQSGASVGVRAACDICCVIDVSGSMSDEVSIHGAHQNERSGLSQLDIAKHALKTIINCLTDRDRLSVVSFSDRGAVLFDLKSMDEDGRQEALRQVQTLSTGGSTNLWDGLKTGLDVLSAQQRQSACNVALFLLTDGCPMEIPEGGHLTALEEYQRRTNFTCSINTFGFGYSLDSQLLDDLARMGNAGSYAFIPDGTFVGTVFVNAIANLLTTVATNVKLTIANLPPAVENSSIYLSHYHVQRAEQQFPNENGLCFHLGSVTFAQSKDLIVPMSFEQYQSMKFILDYQSAFGPKTKQCTSIVHVEENEQIWNRQKHRLEFVHYVRKYREEVRARGGTTLEGDQSSLQADYRTLKEAIEKDLRDDGYLSDLLKDLTGQVQEAFSRRDWFAKWGVHYLLSIANAHLQQQCNNFKDPGVQHYGHGQLFDSIRDEMDSIFCGLPPPVQTIRHSSGPQAPIDMSAFNNSDDPCFHPSCTVQLLDGSIKLVKDIQRGDQLFPHGGKVTYILKTIRRENPAKMILFDTGLIITPWHPIRLNGRQWVHPCSIHPPTEMLCDSVYSFALDSGHTMLVNEIECVTLGHAFREDLLRHQYYGTQRVIEDLRHLDGQQNCNGFIEISPNWIRRSKRTGLVNRIQNNLPLSNV